MTGFGGEPSEAARVRSGVVEVSTINCIFVFVSDIGADAMVRLTLGYGNRASVPTQRLRKDVRAAMDAHPSTQHIAKSVVEVVPFLPMERGDVEAVLSLKLWHMGETHQRVFWRDLSVDGAVVREMSKPAYIKYLHSP